MKEIREITSPSRDLSLQSYREANRLDIYISKVGNAKADNIFSAYATSTFNNSASVSFGSYSQDLLNFLNGANGPVGSAMWAGISHTSHSISGGAPTTYTSLFDAPISPYMKSLSEQSWTVDCVLIMDDTEYTSASECFSKSIVEPLNTLYHVFLPSLSDNLANDVINEINNAIDKVSNWLEEGHKDNIFFVGASGAVRALKKYTDQLKPLNVPIQMHDNVSLRFLLGRFDIDNVLIEDLNCEFGDMVMRSGDEVFPAFCKVKIKFKGKFRNRIDTVWSGNMRYNKVVDSY